ncbi:hypothetical protein KEM54_003188 [Ascosphaera aggregata]|nr:hypothetical protein KEM54_003188 [Ascosphaera aggregata]
MSSTARVTARKVVDATAVVTAKAIRYPVIGKKVIQGRLRHPGSKAADNYRLRESARLKRQNSVLSQLVYHGKKTVPAKLRKDMWSPYFSLHFSSSRHGLEVYRLLREFSMLRQFSPPEDMIKITEEYLQRRRPKDELKAKNFDEDYKRNIGCFMSQNERARVLMDQKASSVADAAKAIDIVLEDEKTRAEEAKAKEEQKQKLAELNQLKKEAKAKGEPLAEAVLRNLIVQPTGEPVEQKKKLSKKAKVREEQRKQRAEVRDKQAQKRLAELEYALAEEMHVHEAQVLVDEKDFQGKPVRVEKKLPGIQLATYDERTPHHNVPENQVHALWVDMADANYTNVWHDNVVHGKLRPGRQHVIEYLLDEADQTAQRPPSPEGSTAVPIEVKPKEISQDKEKKLRSLLGKWKFW